MKKSMNDRVDLVKLASVGKVVLRPEFVDSVATACGIEASRMDAAIVLKDVLKGMGFIDRFNASVLAVPS